RKNAPVSTTLLKPTSSKRGFHRTAVPNKPGWEREEVQRQSGATKGQWDIYFYAPGRRFPLRSRPEIQDYCEKTLNVPYNPDEFSWKPTEAPIDTVSPVDTDNEGETQTMTPENDNVDSDPECYTFAVFEIKHSPTFMCSGKMADFIAPCHFNLKQFGGHCQCHWNHIRGQTSNLQANDKAFHAQFSREAIAQRIALLEHDRFRRDLDQGGLLWNTFGCCGICLARTHELRNGQEIGGNQIFAIFGNFDFGWKIRDRSAGPGGPAAAKIAAIPVDPKVGPKYASERSGDRLAVFLVPCLAPGSSFRISTQLVRTGHQKYRNKVKTKSAPNGALLRYDVGSWH
uniref:MBD domain-containing protein n=1 Tax=Strigamia maritima TaxID=126957 RepID=T1J139_STRMM